MLSKRSAKALTWLSVFMPFEHVKSYYKDIEGIDISETCLKETTHRLGSRIHEIMEVKGRRPETIKGPKISSDVMYIQADGSMVPIRGEKEREFKEAKLGLIYTNRDIVQRKTKKGEISTDIRNKRFVCSIGEGVEPFKKMMYAAAREKGYFKSKKVVVLSDGATWISKMRHEYFPRAIHILDWYHAMEHLWQAAYKIFGESKTAECEEWVKRFERLLWAGKVDKVIKELDREIFRRKKYQTELIQLRGYYFSNRTNMRYNEFRKNGFYIGSGAIESAHKYIIASRLKQAGMRWTVSHANAMIWLRSKYFENTWDEFWKTMSMKEYFKPVKSRAA